MGEALKGIFTPHIVPLQADGEIDEPELRRYIDWLVAKGVHGLYPNGSTGEFTRFTPDELGSIRTRVMICTGDHDVIRPDHTQALARAIPNATLWIVPDASHSAMFEKPALVNARVLAFLAR